MQNNVFFRELKGRLSKQLTNKSNKTVITRLTHNCAHLRLDNRKNKTKLSQNQVSRHFRSFPEEKNVLGDIFFTPFPWFNSMSEFCQKIIHSILYSILLLLIFNSKYYSIQNIIQFKINSGDSIQKIFNSIVRESLILVKQEKCPKMPKECPK